MRTEKSKWRTHKDQVRKRCTGAESPVVARKSPRKGWSEGVMLWGLTRRVNQQWEEPMSEAKPAAVPGLLASRWLYSGSLMS